MCKKVLMFLLLHVVCLQVQASEQYNQLSPLNKQRFVHLIMMNSRSQNMVKQYNEFFRKFTCDENQEQEVQEIISLCEQNLSNEELMFEKVKQDPADLDEQWADFIFQAMRNSDTAIHRTKMLEPFLEENKYSSIH